MAQLQRATIAADLEVDINRTLTTMGAYLDVDAWEFKRLRSAADKLSNADAYAGSKAKALIWHMAGDAVEAMRWIDNAANWPGKAPEIRDLRSLVLSNLGYFAEAAACLGLMIEGRSREGALPSIALLCASFRELVSADVGVDLAGPEDVAGMQALARRCAMTLDTMNIAQEQVRHVLAIAGEVLREHRMMFHGQVPVIHALPDGLLYELVVAAPVETTVQMTDEVYLKMIERNLDVPGLSFSFIPS